MKQDIEVCGKKGKLRDCPRVMLVGNSSDLWNYPWSRTLTLLP